MIVCEQVRAMRNVQGQHLPKWRKNLMRLVITFLLAATLLVFSGCSGQNDSDETAERSTGTAPSTAPAPAQSKQSGGSAAKSDGADPKMETVSLTDAQTNQQNAGATERKIIRNAELMLETDSPSDGQRKVGTIAEAHGGFVVTSDA